MENDSTLTKWDPGLSPEGQQHAAAIEARVASNLPIMRRLRLALGMTQREAADLLGVTQSNISKLELRGDPPLSMLARLADARGWHLRLSFEQSNGHEELSLDFRF